MIGRRYPRRLREVTHDTRFFADLGARRRRGIGGSMDLFEGGCPRTVQHPAAGGGRSSGCTAVARQQVARWAGPDLRYLAADAAVGRVLRVPRFRRATRAAAARRTASAGVPRALQRIRGAAEPARHRGGGDVRSAAVVRGAGRCGHAHRRPGDRCSLRAALRGGGCRRRRCDRGGERHRGHRARWSARRPLGGPIDAHRRAAWTAAHGAAVGGERSADRPARDR